MKPFALGSRDGAHILMKMGFFLSFIYFKSTVMSTLNYYNLSREKSYL